MWPQLQLLSSVAKAKADIFKEMAMVVSQYNFIYKNRQARFGQQSVACPFLF